MDLGAWARSLAGALEGALATGSVTAYLIVFAAGILASLTPCVYPIIPITISVIGGRSKGPRHGFFLSIAYALGMASTYAMIGMGFAALRTLAGKQIGVEAIQNSPWVSAGIAVICVLFAMVMLDKLALPMPSGVQNWQSKRRGGDMLSAYLAGIVFGTIASPCLAPVVGLIALEVAKTGRILYGGTMLFTFGLGLGMLFIVIGTSAGAATSLPKAGAWMDRIKSLFAWMMLAIALAYMFQAGKLANRAEVGNVEVAGTMQVAAGAAIEPLAIGAAAGARVPDAPLGSGTLSDLWQDKALVLVFFAPWCHNCPEKVPHANELAKRLPDQARVLAVGSTVPASESKLWAAKHEVGYELLADPEGTLLGAYHPEDPSGLPWMAIISRGGELLYRDVSWPENADELVAKGFAATPGRGAAAGASAASSESAVAAVASVDVASGTAPGEGALEVLPEAGLAAGVVGETAPDLALRAAGGSEGRLSGWWGESALLVCIYGMEGGEETREIQRASELAAKIGSGLRVVVVTGAPKLDEAEIWARENGASGALLVDPAREALRLLGGGATKAPCYALIARGGKLVHAGSWPSDAEAMLRSADDGS